MNPDRYPFRFRVKAAVRAAWACLRGDQTVQRIPLRAAERRPMCVSLAKCCQTTAELDRAATEIADLRQENRTLRSRLAHPSNREPRS